MSKILFACMMFPFTLCKNIEPFSTFSQAIVFVNRHTCKRLEKAVCVPRSEDNGRFDSWALLKNSM